MGAQLAFHFQRRGHRVAAADNLVRHGGKLNLPRFRHHGVEFAFEKKFAGILRNLPAVIARVSLSFVGLTREIGRMG